MELSGNEKMNLDLIYENLSKASNLIEQWVKEIEK